MIDVYLLNGRQIYLSYNKYDSQRAVKAIIMIPQAWILYQDLMASIITQDRKKLDQLVNEEAVVVEVLFKCSVLSVPFVLSSWI